MPKTKSNEQKFEFSDGGAFIVPHFSFPLRIKESSQLIDYILDKKIGTLDFVTPQDRMSLVQEIYHSLSLDYEEKTRVLDKYCTLSQLQFDELRKVFSDERERFITLGNEYPDDICHLNLKNTIVWIIVFSSREYLHINLLDFFLNYTSESNTKFVKFILDLLEQHSLFDAYIEIAGYLLNLNLSLSAEQLNNYFYYLTTLNRTEKLASVSLSTIENVDNKLWLHLCRLEYLFSFLNYAKCTNDLTLDENNASFAEEAIDLIGKSKLNVKATFYVFKLFNQFALGKKINPINITAYVYWLLNEKFTFKPLKHHYAEKLFHCLTLLLPFIEKQQGIKILDFVTNRLAKSEIDISEERKDLNKIDNDKLKSINDSLFLMKLYYTDGAFVTNSKLNKPANATAYKLLLFCNDGNVYADIETLCQSDISDSEFFLYSGLFIKHKGNLYEKFKSIMLCLFPERKIYFDFFEHIQEIFSENYVEYSLNRIEKMIRTSGKLNTGSDFVEIVMWAQGKFGVDMPYKEVRVIKTVGEFAFYIANKVNSTNGSNISYQDVMPDLLDVLESGYNIPKDKVTLKSNFIEDLGLH